MFYFLVRFSITLQTAKGMQQLQSQALNHLAPPKQ